MWVFDKDKLSEIFGPTIPWWILKYVVASNVKKQLHAQGIGRHTREEVEHIGEIDLDAISVYLGTYWTPHPTHTLPKMFLVSCVFLKFLAKLIFWHPDPPQRVDIPSGESLIHL